MSNKKKYNNYSKMANEPKKEEVVDTSLPEEVEAVEAEPVAEPVEEIPTIEAVKVKYGEVVNCTRLNVRWSPDAKADIIGTIDKGTTVEIHDTKTTNGFYEVQVYMPAPRKVKGYCMKKFIKINK
jgi:uncharacterized protein YgiM (DUF1202 family)